MAHQKGANTTLLMGFETTFKTVSTAGFELRRNTSSISGSQSLNSPATLQGNRNPVEPFRGNRDVSGNVVVPVDSIALWYWLKGLFGDPVTTGTGPYVHEFKIQDSQPSMTFEHQFPDLSTASYARFTGCKLGGMSISTGGDGELTADFSVVGAVDSLEASSFDALPTAVGFSRLNNFQAAIEEGGSSLANATELSVSLDMSLDGDQYVIGGGGVRGSIPEKTVAVSGNLKTLFENTTLLNKAINGTESSLKLTFTGGASSVFELEMQEVQFERKLPDVQGPQGILVDLNYQAYYTNGSEASAIVARLTNSEAHA